jgi:hypothetical protein
MASGNQLMKLNTRERVVSDDWNRLQNFLGREVAELWRWMLSSSMSEGGAAAVGAATTSPLSAVVINGLWARPEIGTVNLFVQPGALGMVNPDVSPNADDSPFKMIVDAGVQAAGALTLTAGSVSTRMDVVECSRVEEVIESGSRDIFNPATGLFVPATVDKVIRNRLTYRIRVGTPGAGFPGTASGWLPLAVASVPSSATTWNDCTVWDVRPLMMDLVREPGQVLQTFPTFKGFATVADVLPGPTRTLRGMIEGVYRQWRIGGDFGPTLSGLTDGAVDLLSADIVEPGFAPVGNSPWYVYAMFPHGLPRWAKYSPSSSGFRQPLTPKGILVFTQKPPASGLLQAVNVAVTMPTSLGFTVAQTIGVPVATGVYDDGATFLDSLIADGWTKFGIGGLATAQQVGLLQTPVTGNNTATPGFDLVDNVAIPVGATAVRVRFSATLTLSGGAGTAYGLRKNAQVRDPTNVASGILFASSVDTNEITAGSGAVFVTHEVELPLHSIGAMPSGAPITRRLVFDMVVTPAAGTVAFSNERMWVTGWKLGC